MANQEQRAIRDAAGGSGYSLVCDCLCERPEYVVEQVGRLCSRDDGRSGLHLLCRAMEERVIRAFRQRV